MTIRLLEGDCRLSLASLPSGSIQTCITSPPYYSLRDYGTQPLIWGGDGGFEHEHVWTDLGTRGGSAQRQGTTSQRKGRANVEAQSQQTTSQGAVCACGAWLGSLGLEPTLELYVEHVVEVFRLVRRVLRDDGMPARRSEADDDGSNPF